MSVIIVISTIPKQQADRIAKKLLESRLAACITLIPGVISYYFWDNKLQKTNEFQMLIKSDQINQERLLNLLREIHPYELPELLVIPIQYADEKYNVWLKECLTKIK
ncbi:divalent-cation tolerance protein CutA [Candidatus Pantoea edessiphila]|uniref:Divalent-cation tolerance protein CutA n=1 Tax=Candidatus Pantoea edessiphila TaxID=2044610 RepID=A0A2P5SZZ8_9GAMM|nr:divalent cation tolerance protein CutA [Candidatus Pantoea edessiphila]PPI87905.1 divalent-cation tolerance protein CutA [Candidatus Pantoea edessiphila]